MRQHDSVLERIFEKQISEHLAHITRFGWDEAYDNDGSLYYWHGTSGEMQWDRPVYTIEEYYASQRILSFARSILAKQEVSWLRELLSRAEALERQRVKWEAAEGDRDNLVTVHLDIAVCKRVDARLVSRDEELKSEETTLQVKLDQAGMCAEDARGELEARALLQY